MTGARTLLLACLAGLAAAVLAGPAGAAVAPCRPDAPFGLRIAAAARTPVLVGTTPSTLGVAGATKLANELSAAGQVCSAKVSPAVQARLAKVLRAYAAGDKAGARRQLAAVIASIRARRPAAVHPGRRTPAAAKGKCAVDRTIRVKPKDATKVGDYLGAARAAQQIKDEAASQQALDGARSAYGDWAKGAMGSQAKSVGDYVSIAKGATLIGAEEVSQQALDKARGTAESDVKKAGEFDKCTVSVDDFNCQVRAVATAQLLGADVGAESAKLAETSQAIGDRLEHKVPDGCEEWSFTMKLTDVKTGWAIRWIAARFRVSRESGTLDGSHIAGYGAGWPGFVGDLTSDCIETTDEGEINHGPGTIKGGPFHFALDGSVTADGFTLNVASQDAAVSVTGPSDVGCQVLVTLGDQVINAFVKGPYELPFTLAPDQTSATIDSTSGDTSFVATITRRAP